eukprot:scaffold260866_cov32-Tisochrysis_lutea.AAC.2
MAGGGGGGRGGGGGEGGLGGARGGVCGGGGWGGRGGGALEPLHPASSVKLRFSVADEPLKPRLFCEKANVLTATPSEVHAPTRGRARSARLPRTSARRRAERVEELGVVDGRRVEAKCGEGHADKAREEAPVAVRDGATVEPQFAAQARRWQAHLVHKPIGRLRVLARMAAILPAAVIGTMTGANGSFGLTLNILLRWRHDVAP